MWYYTFCNTKRIAIRIVLQKCIAQGNKIFCDAIDYAVSIVNTQYSTFVIIKEIKAFGGLFWDKENVCMTEILKHKHSNSSLTVAVVSWFLEPHVGLPWRTWTKERQNIWIDYSAAVLGAEILKRNLQFIVSVDVEAAFFPMNKHFLNGCFQRLNI